MPSLWSVYSRILAFETFDFKPDDRIAYRFRKMSKTRNEAEYHSQITRLTVTSHSHRDPLVNNEEYDEVRKVKR